MKDNLLEVGDEIAVRRYGVVVGICKITRITATQAVYCTPDGKELNRWDRRVYGKDRVDERGGDIYSHVQYQFINPEIRKEIVAELRRTKCIKRINGKLHAMNINMLDNISSEHLDEIEKSLDIILSIVRPQEDQHAVQV